nr:MAG TPA: hypothetical protein [Caudoviricetes sp.]
MQRAIDKVIATSNLSAAIISFPLLRARTKSWQPPFKLSLLTSAIQIS